MNRQGSSSSMHVVSSPLPSAGFDGHTTLMPGVCMNHASSDCECWAPNRRLPTVVRMVIGTGVSPPDM